MVVRRGRAGAKIQQQRLRPRVVVLTEDTAGVRDYLEERFIPLKDRALAIDVKVISGRRPDARSLFIEAKSLVEGGTDALRRADYVFLVFDRDSQLGHFRRARHQAAQNVRLEACATVPCFEYWFLLHKNYDLTPYKNAADVIRALEKVYKVSYRKSGMPMMGIMTQAGGDEAEARSRALKGRTEIAATEAEEPWTEIDILLEQIEAAVEATRHGHNPIQLLQGRRYGKDFHRL